MFLKGNKFLMFDVFRSLMVDFVLVNSADPEEMFCQSTCLPVSRLKMVKKGIEKVEFTVH